MTKAAIVWPEKQRYHRRMNNQDNYKYLRRKPGSNYKQLWVFDKGRYIRTRNIYGEHISQEDTRTIEELSEDYDLPIEAVREAIVYCASDPPEIRQDWEDEELLAERLHPQ